MGPTTTKEVPTTTFQGGRDEEVMGYPMDIIRTLAHFAGVVYAGRCSTDVGRPLSGGEPDDPARVRDSPRRHQGHEGDRLPRQLQGYTAAAKGWHMAYTSDYNPETRGGLVEGTVVLSSDEPIDNAVIESYTAVMAFDHVGYLSYGPGVEPGGLILWDSSRVRNPPPLEGVRSYGVPVFQLARDGGAPGLANMGMLGLYNLIAGHFTIDELLAGMKDYLPVWRHKLLPGNRAVLEAVSRIDPEQYRVA